MTSTTDNDLLPEFATCPYCEAKIERGLRSVISHQESCPKYPHVVMKTEVTTEDINNFCKMMADELSKSPKKLKMQVGWNYVELMIEKYGEQKTAEYLKSDAFSIELVLSTDTWKKWQDFAMRNGLMETK